MSVSLGYLSTSPVEASVHAEIIRQCESLCPARGWWAEGVVFFEKPNCPEALCGDTKLFLLGYTIKDGSWRSVKTRHDIVMAYVDAMFVLKALRQWSSLFGIEWQILINGNEATTISGGKLTWKTSLGLSALGIGIRVFCLAPILTWAANRLQRKYADRWND